jgi:hypothetical protein
VAQAALLLMDGVLGVGASLGASVAKGGRDYFFGEMDGASLGASEASAEYTANTLATGTGASLAGSSAISETNSRAGVALGASIVITPGLPFVLGEGYVYAGSEVEADHPWRSGRTFFNSYDPSSAALAHPSLVTLASASEGGSNAVGSSGFLEFKLLGASSASGVHPLHWPSTSGDSSAEGDLVDPRVFIAGKAEGESSATGHEPLRGVGRASADSFARAFPPAGGAGRSAGESTCMAYYPVRASAGVSRARSSARGVPVLTLRGRATGKSTARAAAVAFGAGCALSHSSARAFHDLAFVAGVGNAFGTGFARAFNAQPRDLSPWVVVRREKEVRHVRR